MSAEPTPLRRPGRPRKWATTAERSREYRRRRAAHLAQPMLLLARAGDLERELRATSEELCRARRALAVTERKLDQVREKHDAERQKTARLRDEVRRVRELLRFERSRYRPPQRFTDSFDSDDEWAGARVCPPDDR